MIAQTRYELDDVAADAELRDELNRYLQIYESVVDARGKLAAADPITCHTPTVLAKPSKSNESDVFAPKSAPDYVTTITAHK